MRLRALLKLNSCAWQFCHVTTPPPPPRNRSYSTSSSRWSVPSVRCCIFTVYVTASLSLLRLHQASFFWNMVIIASICMMRGCMCTRCNYHVPRLHGWLPYNHYSLTYRIDFAFCAPTLLHSYSYFYLPWFILQLTSVPLILLLPNEEVGGQFNQANCNLYHT